MMTLKRINTIIQRHEQLMNQVDDFIAHKKTTGRGHSESRIRGNMIEKYVNTACHCHPEMEWLEVGTVEEFAEWLNK